MRKCSLFAGLFHLVQITNASGNINSRKNDPSTSDCRHQRCRMTEMWLPIVGFGRFEVSDQGRIRRLAYTITKKSRGGGQHQRTFLQTFLAMQTHTNGYLTVRLHPSKTSRMVSRLVCEAFNGPPPSPEYHADHINGVRDDNRATNLRWLSPAANRAKAPTRHCTSQPYSLDSRN